eukprot:110311-Rhodomonas_salina.1
MRQVSTGHRVGRGPARLRWRRPGTALLPPGSSIIPELSTIHFVAPYPSLVPCGHPRTVRSRSLPAKPRSVIAIPPNQYQQSHPISTSIVLALVQLCQYGYSCAGTA